MRTRVNRLRHEGVAVAKFYVDKDESFILGRNPTGKKSTPTILYRWWKVGSWSKAVP